jgi:hypothetical protein
MARYLMLALNGASAKPDDEAAYDQWYRDVHIPDLLSVPEVRTARRYKTVHSSTDWKYVAAYEIETDDLAATTQTMRAAMRPSDPALDKGEAGQILAIEIGD